MGRVRFSWDEGKNAANRRKHGVSFETAAAVFSDPFVIFEQDRDVEGEARWQAVGRIGEQVFYWWRMRMKKREMKKQSGLSRRGLQSRGSGRPTLHSSVRTVTTEELEKDPKAKARSQRELARLAAGTGPIDVSDAAELPAPAWENPVRGMEAWLRTVRESGIYKPVKQAVSMRLDADVVAWLKQNGRGYQTRVNRILREKMMAEAGLDPTHAR
jgi:uncharacterized protein (DUF4415 family)